MSDSPSILDTLNEGDPQNLEERLRNEPELARFRDRNGLSLLMHCLYRQREDLALVVEQGLYRLELVLDGFEAAALGRAERLADLLSEDPSQTGAISADGFTVLHLAGYFDREDALRAGLAAGCPVNAVSHNAMTLQPLHSAAASGNSTLVRLLLEAGADVSASQAGGFCALHAAAAHGDEEMVKVLLEYGASADQPTHDGQTARHFAEQNGHEAVIELLGARASS